MVLFRDSRVFTLKLRLYHVLLNIENIYYKKLIQRKFTNFDYFNFQTYLGEKLFYAYFNILKN